MLGVRPKNKFFCQKSDLGRILGRKLDLKHASDFKLDLRPIV